MMNLYKCTMIAVGASSRWRKLFFSVIVAVACHGCVSFKHGHDHQDKDAFILSSALPSSTASSGWLRPEDIQQATLSEWNRYREQIESFPACPLTQKTFTGAAHTYICISPKRRNYLLRQLQLITEGQR